GGLERMLSRDIEASIVPEGVSASAFVSTEYLDTFLRLRDQKRSFSYLELPAPALSAPPADDEIKAYYDANIERYRSEEQVSIEYVEIDPAAIQVGDDVSDEVLRQRYA